jgi:LysM repeat protein
VAITVTNAGDVVAMMLVNNNHERRREFTTQKRIISQSVINPCINNMSEGGFLNWKRQAIDTHRGPAANYNNLRRPLPKPPKNTHWVLRNNKDWHLEALPERDLILQATTDATTVNVVVDEKTGDLISGGTIATTFLEHTVQSSDTFQGICLRYKITPTELRRANYGFSGSNLSLAPTPLRIPTSDDSHLLLLVEGVAVVEENGSNSNNSDTTTSKVNSVLRVCPGMAKSEAKCYLELNDWDLEQAVSNARQDGF